MTVCLDTNVFLQIFGRRQPFYPVLRALLEGRLNLAISTSIWLEYEEITKDLSGVERWRDVVAFVELLAQLHGNIRYVDPRFRFGVIAADPDDNKFCDCAIAADADFVLTDDHHFDPLAAAAYRPKPIKPEEFIRLHLTAPRRDAS